MDMHVAASQPLLLATSISGHLEGLIGEIRITQTFLNQEQVNLEAIFTFPVPLEAVLLGVAVEIDERLLEGRVMPRAEAEEDYENAIVAGDGAVRLQQAGVGRFTVNVGNLLPGQRARLAYRYGLLGTWSADTWRLSIPTTLAPRYGSAQAAGLQPHQVPEVSVTADHRFTLDLTLGGALASASVDSPSHALRIVTEGPSQRVGLAAECAPLDRDLVLLMRAPDAARTAQALVAQDGDGAVALVSLQPSLPRVIGPAGRDLVVVADCSGSMAGVSIAQTRDALAAILDRLTPVDRINLIAFGSRPRAVFPTLRPVGGPVLQQARDWVEALDADQGGTEMGRALELAFQQGDERPLDILLITDGQVWGVDPLVARAGAAGHRLFTVGVGAAVAEDLVRGLADATGGAAVLVHPNETMADQIVRQFERMRAPRVTLDLSWPGAPEWTWPAESQPCYDGDTLHRLAGWVRAPDGRVGLTQRLDDGSTQVRDLALAPWPTSAPADLLPRLAAARRLSVLPETEACELAVRYQLVTALTDLLMIDARDEATRATTLPVLRQVPHTLAAGWGGMGEIRPSRVAWRAVSLRLAKREIEPLHLTDRLEDQSMGAPWEPTAPDWGRKAPARRAARGASPPPPRDRSGFATWLSAQESRLGDPGRRLPSLGTVARACGLPRDLRDTLQRMIQDGAPADAVVATLLIALFSNSPSLHLGRQALRRLRFENTRGLEPAVRAEIMRQVDAWWNGAGT
jgi:Ca-activated chloride channel family protein